MDKKTFNKNLKRKELEHAIESADGDITQVMDEIYSQCLEELEDNCLYKLKKGKRKKKRLKKALEKQKKKQRKFKKKIKKMKKELDFSQNSNLFLKRIIMEERFAAGKNPFLPMSTSEQKKQISAPESWNLGKIIEGTYREVE